MAKNKNYQVHVTSSDMTALLNAQTESMKSLKTISETMQLIKLTEFANLYETKQIDDDGDKHDKIAEQNVKVNKEILKVQKDISKSIKEQGTYTREEAKAIANIAKGMQTFKTMGDRISDMGKSFKDKFGSGSALKTTALKAVNVGGIFDKSIAKEKFIQTQRKLGSEDDRSTLSGKFETANRASKDIKKNEAEISQLKKDTGMSEADLAKRGAGKDLFAKRTALTDTLAGADLRAASLKSTEAPESSPTQKHAESGANEEQALEAQKQAQKQEDLFIKIEQNTRGGSPDQKDRKSVV